MYDYKIYVDEFLSSYTVFRKFNLVELVIKQKLLALNKLKSHSPATVILF
jgi:hypothetical protein